MASGGGGKFKSGCLGVIVVFILIGALASPKSGSSKRTSSTEDTHVQLLSEQESSVRNEESSQMRKSTSNPYGSFTTPCQKKDCKNFITMTGYSHYCYDHSAKCQSCGAYIDPDQTFCPECYPLHSEREYE